MTKLPRLFLPMAGLCLAFALSACAGGDADQFDPTDWVPTNWFGGGKKPLPGVRHDVFPGGVPGVPTGVPPDLVMGHQQTPDANGAITTDALAEQHPDAQGQGLGQASGRTPGHQAAAETPKEKLKHVASKPKHVASKPKHAASKPKHAASKPKHKRSAGKRPPKKERRAESAPAAQRAPAPASQPQPSASAAPWPTSQPAAQSGAAWPTPSQ